MNKHSGPLIKPFSLVVLFILLIPNTGWPLKTKYSVSGRYARLQENKGNLAIWDDTTQIADPSKIRKNGKGLYFKVGWEKGYYGLALTYNSFRSDSENVTPYFSTESLDFGTFGTFYKTKALGADVYLRVRLFKRFKFIIGGGLEFNSVTYIQRQEYSSHHTLGHYYLYKDQTIDARGSVVTKKYFVALEYYINRDTAIQIEVGKVGGTVDELELKKDFDPNTGFSVKQLKGSTLKKMNSETDIAEENVILDLSNNYLAIGIVLWF